jgi:hypothetical protein
MNETAKIEICYCFSSSLISALGFPLIYDFVNNQVNMVKKPTNFLTKCTSNMLRLRTLYKCTYFPSPGF